MDRYSKLLDVFEKPGVEYRGKPFWSWNGELKEKELKRQVDVMKEMGLGGYFMHSRAGLITEYLGEEWFDLTNKVADYGQEIGLESWLYDEDRWPSGSAGGKVTIDPQYRMKSLVLTETDIDKLTWDGDIVSVFAGRVDGFVLDDYFEINKETDLSSLIGYKALKFTIVPDEPASVYNGTTYIDTMSLKATKRFIELTHDKYKEHCKERLGTSIKGIFTDEPHRGHMLDNLKDVDGVRTCYAAYTDDFFFEFKNRYGYDAKAIIPEFFYQYKGNKVNKIKLNYIDLANNLFIERFALPINDWCKENNIELTGHVLHEDSFTNQSVPNGSLMRFYEYMGYPGVDVLTEGNKGYWIVKQLTSAARQLGKKWLLSELYGCTGWQFDFKGHKAVGDWQALFGINLRCQHLSWYSMEGESKRDYPASILHQSAYYPYYRHVEDYFARFGAIISSGKEKCDLLVLNAIESAWCQAHMGWARWISSTDSDVQELERHYAKLFHILAGNQIDFDYGEEEMMSRHAKVENGKLLVGKAKYSTVLISGALTMRETTLKLLEDFVKEGGKLIFSGDLPKYVDAIESDLIKGLAKKAIVVDFEEEHLVKEINNDIAINDREVFCQIRDLADSQFIVILNTNRDEGKERIEISYKYKADTVFVEEWDMLTGMRYKHEDFTYDGKELKIKTSMHAAGEKVFVLVEEDDNTLITRPVYKEIKSFNFNEEVEYTLDEKNVLVLDFAKWKFDDNAWQEEDEVLKVDGKVRDLNKMEHRSGGMLQPWFAKLHDTKVYGKLELEYEFFIDILPQEDLILAGERPEYWDYSINDHKLSCDDFDDFWIDECFKKMVIPKEALKLGLNKVNAKTDFMRTTNIEALYVIGDFGVKISGNKSTMTSLPKTIGFDNLINYNMPFYSGTITYKIPSEKIKNREGRTFIEVPSFTGSLVIVNDTILGWDPYEADVTEAIREGKDIEVTLVCSRRNTFGPLHLVPLYHGAYGPGHFTTGGNSWTNDYNLIDSCIKDGLKIKTMK